MKTAIKSLGVAVLGIGLFIGCAKKQSESSWSLDKSPASAQLKMFVAEKEVQAEAAAKAKGEKMLPEFNTLVGAAAKGDWSAVSNIFADLESRAPQYQHSSRSDPRLRGIQWQVMLETYGAFEQFADGGDEKYPIAFGRDIIQSIPAGSIYFGGTDPGRFLITAMQKSHVDGDPFFTLTQNALADATYLDYLQSMYGNKICIPTREDLQKCFEDYAKDAQQRLKDGKLKPGEDVKQVEGQMQVSGQIAVMEINGLLVRVIFDKNPNRGFYIEESFPLDWMYPYLEPHGLIMKVNRQPIGELSGEIVRRDHDYWTQYVTPMIGGWLNDDTSVEDVAAFAEKVYLKRDYSDFKGDPLFIQSTGAQKNFSKLRSSIAGVYAWRAQHTASDAERKRMQDEADFAFRQAWALCPYSPETVFRYVALLLDENRRSDALLVARVAANMPAMQGDDGSQMRALVERLEKSRTTN